MGQDAGPSLRKNGKGRGYTKMKKKNEKEGIGVRNE